MPNGTNYQTGTFVEELKKYKPVQTMPALDPSKGPNEYFKKYGSLEGYKRYRQDLAKWQQQQEYSRRQSEFEKRYGQFTELQEEWWAGLAPKVKSALRREVGYGLGGQLRGLEQTMGRRGLTGSGLEYAGEVALRTGAEQQYLEGVADFETAMAQQMGAERAQFVGAEFDFFRQLYQMDYAQQLQKQILEFQYQMAQKYDSSGWADFFGSLGDIAGTLGAAWIMRPAATATTGGTYSGMWLGW